MMKSAVIILFLGCFSFVAMAQTIGNQKIVTQSFQLPTIESISVGLYAKVIIDCSIPDGITITGDENLIDLIAYEVVDGTLKLSQKTWIQPSQHLAITIGAPRLSKIEQGTHDSTTVININNQEFAAMALIGSIALKGQTLTLSLDAESGLIDATQMDAPQTRVNIWDDGMVWMNTSKEVLGVVKNEGLLVYQDLPSKLEVTATKGGRIQSFENFQQQRSQSVQYINFKIKNNSGKKIDAFVKGPNGKGRHFSYGFPMKAGQTRKERWSVGSQVYLVTDLGLRKKLIEVKPENADQVVNLF